MDRGTQGGQQLDERRVLTPGGAEVHRMSEAMVGIRERFPERPARRLDEDLA